VTDLLARTAELVDIASVSHDEGAITDFLAARLADAAGLDVTRVGNNLVARTSLGRSQRIVLAGHTDTVPVNGNAGAHVDGDVLWGLGSADMKAGIAVLVELARTVSSPSRDVTYVFYECEEVDARFNGIGRLFAERPDLLADADVAVLGEPTAGLVEAGCQGTLRMSFAYEGQRAHTARAWLGRNAIHRLGPALRALESYRARTVTIDGCEYREGLQAVRVSGGVAGNVVPDRAELVVNHRFAPDRSAEDAEAHVRSVIGQAGEADEVALLDVAPGAAPALDHPVLAALVAGSGHPPRAKLGWTDVARFAAHGIPATNFGPGDPDLAHTADERVERASIDAVFATLRELLTS
jgi:succinyl-diaminopimelate desuccinylase